MLTSKLLETPDPAKALNFQVGVASPLWGLYASMASAGVAFWWLARWRQATNLEALLPSPAAVEPEPEPEPVAAPVAEAAPALAPEPVPEPLEAAPEPVEAVVEAAPEPAPEPVVEAAPEPVIETPAPTVRKAKAKPAAEA
jgi:outer membrane biosynthesis protein TonB